MKRILNISAVVALLTWFNAATAQHISSVEPPNWWVGMEHNEVELMCYGKNLGAVRAVVDYPGVEVVNTYRPENDNYLFITLRISEEAVPGEMTVKLQYYSGAILPGFNWELKERASGAATREGFSSKDFMYLLMPDRFANGDPSNDNIEGMEQVDRQDSDGRHGGDIQGIINHLDYLEDLGVTSLWLNPVLENNAPKYSYHGYGITDFYKVDARLGDNDLYVKLADEAADHGIGLVMDQVLNHIGVNHWWMKDLPEESWLNQWDEFTQTNHVKQSRFDPYAAQSDKDDFINGWFVKTMPDLNQQNPHVATYLIQNSIWWTEFLGLHGIRVDTWSYSDLEFLKQWSQALRAEYPNMNIVGEEWNMDPNIISYWQNDTYLPSMMDFPLQNAVITALNGPTTWKSAMVDIYTSLGKDYIYEDPQNIMVFPDNHDMSRIYTQLDEDYDKWKMAMTFYFTTRGILQFFYGTEILMTNKGTDAHGVIRTDFPGGWEGDRTNAFTGKRLTGQEAEAQEWVRTLAKIRAQNPAITSGDLLHYRPANEVYVYFRGLDENKVMVVLCRSSKTVTIDVADFAEGLAGYSTGVDQLTGETVDLSGTVELAPMTSYVIKLH